MCCTRTLLAQLFLLSPVFPVVLFVVLTCNFCSSLCCNFLFVVNGVWPLKNKRITCLLLTYFYFATTPCKTQHKRQNKPCVMPLWIMLTSWRSALLYKQRSLYRVGEKSDTVYNYVNIMPHKLQYTWSLYRLNNFNVCCELSPVQMCSFISEHFHHSFRTPAVFLYAHTVNETAFVVS